MKRPCLQGPAQCFLNHVLGEREVFDSKNSSQYGDHFSEFVTEKVLDHLRDFRRLFVDRGWGLSFQSR